MEIVRLGHAAAVVKHDKTPIEGRPAYSAYAFSINSRHHDGCTTSEESYRQAAIDAATRTTLNVYYSAGSPLPDLSQAGVNLAAVARLTIGIGDGKASSQEKDDLDTIYIDDVRIWDRVHPVER
jgi:hypothetical protein